MIFITYSRVAKLILIIVLTLGISKSMIMTKLLIFPLPGIANMCESFTLIYRPSLRFPQTLMELWVVGRLYLMLTVFINIVYCRYTEVYGPLIDSGSYAVINFC